MESLLARVRRGEVIVGDGAWGTMFLDRGLPPGRAPESWTLERPGEIARLAREYFDAGARVITTNTFGGSPARLRQHGLADRLEDVNRTAVELVRDAVSDNAYVSASVGPTGLLLKPLGDADPAEIGEGFERQIQVLASAGADVICIETMTDLVEAGLAVAAARRVAPSAPIIATMTFDVTPRGPFTIMGVSIEQAARTLEEAGAHIVGANCGAGVEDMVEVARGFASHTGLPIAVRSNAGLPYRTGGRLVYPDSPDRFAAACAGLLAHRVAIVGGCCGTTPAHIQALARIVHASC